jgi:two-component system response regulator
MGKEVNNPGTILLVEDNPDDIELTRRAFSRSRLCNEVLVKRDGQEALDYLLGESPDGKPAPLPELILLDLNMPRVSGLEFLQRIRAEPRTSTIPIVVLTTSDEQRDILESYQLGANSYIRKPVNTQEFFDAIQALELYWTVRNIAPRPQE